jgi:hypothetical protein
METMAMDHMTNMAMSHSTSIFSVPVLIDFAGVIAGIFALFIILKSLRKVGGQVGSAFTLTLLGVIAQTLALMESLFVSQLGLIAEPNLGGVLQGHDIHDGLMVIGMLFFVFGAKKFSDLSS